MINLDPRDDNWIRLPLLPAADYQQAATTAGSNELEDFQDASKALAEYQEKFNKKAAQKFAAKAAPKAKGGKGKGKKNCDKGINCGGG